MQWLKRTSDLLTKQSGTCARIVWGFSVQLVFAQLRSCSTWTPAQGQAAKVVPPVGKAQATTSEVRAPCRRETCWSETLTRFLWSSALKAVEYAVACGKATRLKTLAG